MNLVEEKKVACIFSLASDWNLELKILEISMNATRNISIYNTVFADNLEILFMLITLKNVV